MYVYALGIVIGDTLGMRVCSTGGLTGTKTQLDHTISFFPFVGFIHVKGRLFMFLSGNEVINFVMNHLR